MKRWYFPLLCGVLIWFLADAGHLRTAAADALALCAGSVIPALFPFLTVSGLLIALGFGQWAAPLFSGLMTPLFCLPGAAGSALLLGLVGGYPIGAQTAAGLYQAGTLTRSEAERLLAFCNNSNPVFLISVLGAGIFGSVRTGIWLWLIHILSALLTGLLLRRRTAIRQSAAHAKVAPPQAFSSAFVVSVRSAAMTMLSICAFVTLFYVLAAPLRAMDGWAAPVSVGLVELFSLTPLLTADRFGLILASGCTGWGGLSVLAQTAAVLDGSGLSLRPCLLGKALQGILATAITAALSGYILP